MQQMLARPILGPLRRIDARAARRADLYIAISRNVEARIKQTYGIDAEVVYPPVDLNRFRPEPRGDRLLTISRLLPYKRVDLAIRAATRLGMGLDVVGEGPLLSDLREIAGPTVEFHTGLDDAAVSELIASCRAVCVAAEEDFGLVAVEAQAAGKPVIAFAGGGALETVQDGVTGVLFHERTPQAVIEAIRAADLLTTPPEQIAKCARRFSREAFRDGLSTVIARALQTRTEWYPGSAAPLRVSSPGAASSRESQGVGPEQSCLTERPFIS